MLCECLISISLLSYHFHRADYNEVNPGIFVEKSGYVGFAYHNSHSKLTVGVARVFNLYSSRSGVLGQSDKVDLLLGVGTGYRSPVVGALRYTVNQHQFAIVPKVAAINNSWVIAYSYLLP